MHYTKEQVVESLRERPVDSRPVVLPLLAADWLELHAEIDRLHGVIDDVYKKTAKGGE